TEYCSTLIFRCRMGLVTKIMVMLHKIHPSPTVSFSIYIKLSISTDGLLFIFYLHNVDHLMTQGRL
ncbi:MAG: hypothetical protein ACTIIF_02470, partial [Psychrobacter celer]